MAAVDHGLDLPAEQLLSFQYKKLTGRRFRQIRSGQDFCSERASAQEEVDLDLDAAGHSCVVLVVKIPLAQGVFVDAVLQLVPESSGDLFDGSRDFRPFTERGFALQPQTAVASLQNGVEARRFS
jgi:hypothetical protein